jgi:UDPglucose 6-dehydrogenase
MHFMKISVIGGGYVGLVTGACLSGLGHDVTMIDIDPVKVQLIEKGQPPIYENGLEVLLKQNVGVRLRASAGYDSVAKAEIVFICVGTPSLSDGNANLSCIESASISIGEVLKNTKTYCTVVVKSTVPPGTTEKYVQPAVLRTAQKTEREIGFAMNPEFLREGRAVEDFLHPDRIVIGSNDPGVGKQVANVFRNINAPVLYTGLAAAEMIKYTSNAFLATKISFSNEIGNLCKNLDIDVYEVMKGVGLDQRIGPHFLNAGAGFGGSCFPKDISALISLAEKNGNDPILLKSVISINNRQPYRIITLLADKIGSLSGKRIAVLGLAFKDNTEDIRGSRSIPVIEELLNRGALVAVYDPLAMPNMRRILPAIEYCSCAADALHEAEGCLVMTEWPEFTRLDSQFDGMKNRIIIEGRRILSCKDRDGICW